MKKYAVIVAGGVGTRMGTKVPKQFLLLREKPVLWHTLKVFLDAYEDLKIILVLPEAHIEAGRAILHSINTPHRIRIVAGGATRFHSVQNGLQHVLEDEETDGNNQGIPHPPGPPGSSIIFVHDGVRCLLTTGLVHRCYENALLNGSAIPVIDSKDSVRLLTVKGGEGSEAIDRSRVKLVQTPQTFLSDLLLPAYKLEYREGFSDDAMVVEASGGRVHLVEGEVNNIKITTPADLLMAEQLSNPSFLK